MYCTGADPGEVKRVNFHPPLFLSPLLSNFFSYPSNIWNNIRFLLISLIEAGNVHKRWLVLPINLFILSPQTHYSACNPKTPCFHALATLRCRHPGQVCLLCHPDGVRFRFLLLLFVTLGFFSSSAPTMQRSIAAFFTKKRWVKLLLHLIDSYSSSFWILLLTSWEKVRPKNGNWKTCAKQDGLSVTQRVKQSTIYTNMWSLPQMKYAFPRRMSALNVHARSHGIGMPVLEH